MRNEIEGNNEEQVCFIDPRRKFATVDDEILSINLEKHGFRGTILENLRKYLRDQYHFFCVNGD